MMPREHLIKAMGLLTRAADDARAAPSNLELSMALGKSSVSAGSNVIRALERVGWITVARFSMERRITIVASGRSTWVRNPKAKPHFSAGGRRGPTYSGRTVSPAAAPPHVDPIPELAADRWPCGYCGVRSDVGCRHQEASA